MPNSRALAAVAAALLFIAGCCNLPPAAAPAAKPTLDCTFPSTSGAPGLPAGPITGGTYSGAGPITIPAGQTLTLASDLVIWSNDDLTIDGDIELPYASGPGTPTINITLGARKKLTINGRIGGGRAGSGAPATGTSATAAAGTNGGFIKIKAGIVDIEGKVTGNAGGDGGIATAKGVTSNWGLFTTGGSADAVGGSGGNGGDVILCGDLITMAGVVQAGDGGKGGSSAAAAAPGGQACACGGDAGADGDVIFGEASQIDFQSGGFANGGNSWWAGVAVASVAPGGGGNAQAKGGKASGGGTVKFLPGAVVITKPPPPNRVVAGNGGAGGDAEAYGGDGGNGRFFPQRGGNATASATNGGAPGALPQIPLPNGTTVAGTAGSAGKGGDATASGGDGGANTGVGRGASSGSSTANGGADGAGLKPTGGTPFVGPVAGIGAAGGVTGTASQVGAP